MNIRNRIEKLRAVLAEKELDGIFISQPENRRYLSGFNGSAGYLLITAKETLLATDFRYYEQVKIQAPDYTLFELSGKVSAWFPTLTGLPGLQKLGFESADISHAMYRVLTEALKEADSTVQMVPVEGIVEKLRAIKDADELELTKKAIAITDLAFKHIEDTIHPGMTELEVAWELEKFHRENGSGHLAFDVIVASGQNAALPHWQPSEKKIEAREPVVIDMGGTFEGYCSDFTRTLYIGEQDDTYKKVYDIVLGAQLTAISLIKAGMSGKEADGFARTVIEEAGYGDKFGHSLGHGIGLVCHEQPTVGPNSDNILENGMVFSVEPGIYLPGWGGIRIEDLVCLENGEIKVLSQGTK